MENASIIEARELFKNNFVGPDELTILAHKMNLLNLKELQSPVPDIPFSIQQLKDLLATHLLFLGIPYNADGSRLSLLSMKVFFGADPVQQEPCFYNQDWYQKENFASETTMEFKWYLLRKELISETRGIDPETSVNYAKSPSALLCAYAFFLYYFSNKEYLWQNDFVWCNDVDGNGDRVYVARYKDPAGLSKNGFSIHRHLKIRQNYGCIDTIMP